MQFKHVLVALLVLLAFVGTAAAADSVEIRSTIMDDLAPVAAIEYSTMDATIPNAANFDAWLLSAYNWAGFYYDLDDNIQTERMAIIQNGSSMDYKYETIAKAQNYSGTFNTTTETFAIIGFFAEPYVAIGPVGTTAAGSAATGVNAGKLAKLVIDDDASYLLKTGSTLELGEGYTIVADQIDVDGNKALLRFMKDGREINASIVTTSNGNPGYWNLNATVLNERNVSTLRVSVESVFQGTQDSLVEINGLWLIDYLNAVEIKSDEKFGKFENPTIAGGKLTIEAKDVPFGEDMNTLLGNGIYVQTAKDFSSSATTNEFYVYKEYTESGEYEIRSEVLVGYNAVGVTKTYNYTNFAAFHYDLENGGYNETLVLTAHASTANLLPKGTGLVYTTAPEPVGFEFSDSHVTTPIWDTETYSALGLFGERYVALSTKGAPVSTTPAKMAKLVVDSDETYLLKTGSTLELGEGYTVVADQIDVDGNKVLLRFMKDGREINSSIVTTNGSDGGNWFLNSTVLNERNTETLRVHVKSVFQGTQDSLVEISGLWLLDYLNAIEIKSGDMYGVLEATPTTIGGVAVVQFKLDENITLTRDMDKLIANNMYLKTADSGLSNMYFYVLATVGEGTPEAPAPGPEAPQPGPETPAPGPETPAPGPETPQPEGPTEDEKGWLAKNWMYVLAAIVLIIIIAGVAYYFLVMKKQ